LELKLLKTADLLPVFFKWRAQEKGWQLVCKMREKCRIVDFTGFL